MEDDAGHGLLHEQHVCVDVQDRLTSPTSAQPLVACSLEDLTRRSSSLTKHYEEPSSKIVSISVPECRICHEEEDPLQLDAPCDCSGTLKYAHRDCLQRWCDEKGNTICEICQQPYRHGYNASQLQFQGGSVTLDLSDTWGMELRDSRILALAAAQRQNLESDYEDFTAVNSGSAACCRSVALILMTLLLLHHVTSTDAATGNKDAFVFLMIFLLRVVGFLLPCYIVVRAMNMLQQNQQEQVTAMTAAEMSVLLHARHPQGIRVALMPAVELP